MSSTLGNRRLLKRAAGADEIDLSGNVASTIGGLGAKIEALRSELKTLQDVLGVNRRTKGKARKTVPLLAVARSEAEVCSPPHVGFYELAFVANGVAYRWTGPGSAMSFALVPDRCQAQRLDIEVVRFFDAERDSPLRFLTDEQNLACEMTPLDGGTTLADGGRLPGVLCAWPGNRLGQDHPADEGTETLDTGDASLFAWGIFPLDGQLTADQQAQLQRRVVGWEQAARPVRQPQLDA